MKKIIVYVLVAFLIFSFYAVHPVLAQSETPPAGPTGEVRGKIINRNSGKVVAESLQIMLHILDQDYADQGMLHAESQPDGTFLFSDVPFNAGLQFAVMATYDGVTYFSDTTPADAISLQATIQVPVYDSTSDLSNIHVDQMHVLFDIAEDGLEIKEIYAFSNSGEHTVKNAYELGDDPQSGTPQFATLEFPLPDDADYIFFSPDDQDRFIRLSGGFADTYPILPGEQTSQIMVSYLVPYSGKRDYSYTAPINIARINFLVPDQTDIALQGQGLMEPEPMALQNGESYLVYSYAALNAGQTVSVSISGKVEVESGTRKATTPIAIGAAFLGFAIIGAGIWWWRRPDDLDKEMETEPGAETGFDQTVNEIAYLDEAREKGEIDEQEYQQMRETLMKRAKTLMRQDKEK